MTKSKHYIDAYNNPGQIDHNKCVKIMETTSDEKLITILSEQVTGLRHALRDKEKGVYKFKS